MGWFATVAPFLTHPLVLAGLVLVLAFGFYRAMLKAGIIPQLGKNQGSQVVQIILRYGFWLALIVVVLGFGLAFFDRANSASSSPEARSMLGEVVEEKLNTLRKLEKTEQEVAELRKQLQETKKVLDLIQKNHNDLIKRLGHEASEKLKAGEIREAADLLNKISALLEEQHPVDNEMAFKVEQLQRALILFSDLSDRAARTSASVMEWEGYITDGQRLPICNKILRVSSDRSVPRKFQLQIDDHVFAYLEEPAFSATVSTGDVIITVDGVRDDGKQLRVRVVCRRERLLFRR